eukprot:TRINITY_DN1713_c1_g1_i1.p1 TRINITY_DN1713_c1_g1~~TRINITY_DN1713_c1_g1_i1.p1  ORF type:complete len:325 (-),score=81.06 TRINITY_DN1713_c1_g1_i1:392-1366(-)
MLAFWVSLLAFVVAAEEKDGGHDAFNYKLGGDDWEGLCASGERQSPIDVHFGELFLRSIDVQGCELGAELATTNPYVNPGHLVLNRAGQPQATFNYGSSDQVHVTNVGPEIVWLFDNEFSKLNLPIEGGKLAGVLHPNNRVLDLPSLLLGGVQDIKATFVNFHVHSPSEHMYNGYLAPLEGHFVMKIDKEDLDTCPEAGCLSVVSVHFQHDANDTPSQFIDDSLKLIGGEWPEEIGATIAANGTLDFDQLLPKNPRYMLYSGSLTTPPCTEGVLWHVIQEPVPVSIAQVAALQNAIGFAHEGLVRNNRRIQPVNDREMIYHDCI